MKTKILMTLCTLFLLLGGMGCDDDNGSNVPKTLIGTWKCVGFGDALTGNIEEMKPKDCKGCYQISFEDREKFRTSVTTGDKLGKYEATGNRIRITKLFGTDIGQLGSGGKYINALLEIESFEISQERLKLFYRQNRSYLLFNKMK